MPAFCSNCGSPLADGARFCASCGTSVGASGQADQPAAASVGSTAEYIEPRLRTSIPDFVRQQLHPSEQILAAFSASLFDHRRKGEFRHDKFLLTTERIVYYHTGVIHKGMGQMPYRGITGAAFNRGFRHGTVVIEAANAALTIGGVSNDDAAFAERVISAFVGGRPVAIAPVRLKEPAKPKPMEPAKPKEPPEALPPGWGSST
jgi:zinc-ribbon domain/Bacterial PH domain